MATKQEFMASRYAARVDHFLQDGEAILSAGLAQCVQTAERFGRGQGEGYLFLTTQRVLFLDDRLGVSIDVPAARLGEVTSSWIIVPGMRELKLVFSGSWGGPPTTRSFYAAKRLSREFEATFGRSRFNAA